MMRWKHVRGRKGRKHAGQPFETANTPDAPLVRHGRTEVPDATLTVSMSSSHWCSGSQYSWNNRETTSMVVLVVVVVAVSRSSGGGGERS